MTREEAINDWIIPAIKNTWNEKKCNEILEALEQEPCGDCISRKAVLDAIDVKAWEFCDYLISKNRNDEQKPVSHFADTLRECVREELPSVTPQPKTGHWVNRGGDDLTDENVECSACGKWRWGKTNYCPKCGAKMENGY